MERDIQQLQIDTRKQLAANELTESQKPKLTLVEARRQRCRQARYERYVTVHDLRRQGQTQLEIAEKVGIGAETVSRWLNAPEFPEHQRSAAAGDGIELTILLVASPLYLTCRHKRFGITEETFGGVRALLSQGSRTAPFRSAVSSHVEMAKRQETGCLDKGCCCVRISICRSVRDHVTARLESSQTLDNHTLEQRSELKGISTDSDD